VEAVDQRAVELGLGDPRRVERRPRVRDHPAEVGENAFAVGERRKRRLLVLRCGPHPGRI
jgi:hypothetical protein